MVWASGSFVFIIYITKTVNFSYKQVMKKQAEPKVQPVFCLFKQIFNFVQKAFFFGVDVVLADIGKLA